MTDPTLVTFVAYFVLLLGIGVYFYFKSSNIEDYLLGGRGMGSWVTALSAQASDMSGWLLMGLPGAIYLGGVSQSWIAIGLFIGTVMN
ncbi:MAG: sodium:proline symporter, partial [Phycisphaerae bacterium]|nr:sodium:proline symporter [Phycisphaerae bacterium]